MTVYNVTTTVVALVEAPSEEDAIAGLHVALGNAGYTVHVDRGVHEPSAFESEPVDDDAVDVFVYRDEHTKRLRAEMANETARGYDPGRFR